MVTFIYWIKSFRLCIYLIKQISDHEYCQDIKQNKYFYISEKRCICLFPIYLIVRLWYCAINCELCDKSNTFLSIIWISTSVHYKKFILRYRDILNSISVSLYDCFDVTIICCIPDAFSRCPVGAINYTNPHTGVLGTSWNCTLINHSYNTLIWVYTHIKTLTQPYYVWKFVKIYLIQLVFKMAAASQVYFVYILGSSF